jgi:preprotein translocase subunit SecB
MADADNDPKTDDANPQSAGNGGGGPAPEGLAQEGPAQENENAAQPLVILGQYVKDLSFEAPGTPHVFQLLQQRMPEVNIQIEVKAEKVEQSFEVSLQVNADAKVDTTSVYIVELVYCALVNLNVPQEHVGPALLIECPRLMFPFVRAIVADATREAGFAPLMLAPMDFVALYQQRMQADQQAQGGPQPAGPAGPA